MLRYRKWGLDLRATGSDEEAARKVGVRVSPTVVLGYATVALFVFAGAVILLAQLGIGDPPRARGSRSTRSPPSSSAARCSAADGARSSARCFGTGLIVQIINGATFLRLTQAGELFYQGALIVAAAVIYSQIRRRRVLG